MTASSNALTIARDEASAASAAYSFAELGQAAAHLVPTVRLLAEADQLAKTYQSASPFPYIAIDGLWDEGVLDQIDKEFPDTRGRDWIAWDTANERKQTSRGIDGLSSFTQLFFLYLNSNEFVGALRKITGMPDLVPDPTYYGAGLQETFDGGWLDIHGDYIKHPELPLARRLNLLVYLNRDWNPEWGGDIELWDPKTNTRAHGFAPIFNRTVLFTTTSDALHGSPTPVRLPPDRSRRMISVYYWSTNSELLSDSKPIVWATHKSEKIGLKSFIPPVLGILKRKFGG